MKELISKSIFIIREAHNRFKNLAILWSGGKDSTILIHLTKQALPKKEFDNIFIITLDTNYMFPETRHYINKMLKFWNISNYVNVRDDTNMINPKNGVFECCNVNKTNILKDIISRLDLKGIIVGIRRDEQEIRNKERFFSPRNSKGEWDIWTQPCELQGWDIYILEDKLNEHFRVHPLLEWDEADVWEYAKKETIPLNPLYFSEEGKRMRSIGCVPPCTNFIKSEARTIDEIVVEIKNRGGTEREGRHTEKEKLMMERLRALGYF